MLANACRCVFWECCAGGEGQKRETHCKRCQSIARVIKAFIEVLDHTTVNRPSRPAAPAKCSSFLLSSSSPSVVFINHKLTAQAEKQDCSTVWAHIHCAPCAPACGSNKFTQLTTQSSPTKHNVLNGGFLSPEHEIAQ